MGDKTQEKTDVPTKSDSPVNVDKSVTEPKLVDNKETPVSEAKPTENNETPNNKDSTELLITEIVQDLVVKATEKDSNQLETPKTDESANENAPKPEVVNISETDTNTGTPLVDLTPETKLATKVEPIKTEEIVNNGSVLVDVNQAEQIETDSLNGDSTNNNEQNKNSKQDNVLVETNKKIDEILTQVNENGLNHTNGVTNGSVTNGNHSNGDNLNHKNGNLLVDLTSNGHVETKEDVLVSLEDVESTKPVVEEKPKEEIKQEAPEEKKELTELEAFKEKLAMKRREAKEKREREEKERQERLKLASVEQQRREEEARQMALDAIKMQKEEEEERKKEEQEKKSSQNFISE